MLTNSRLCRYAIVFDEPDDLRSCLEVIAVDPDVAVERVNNRISRQYDAHVTAGYRSPLPCDDIVLAAETLTIFQQSYTHEIYSSQNICILEYASKFVSYRPSSLLNKSLDDGFVTSSCPQRCFAQPEADDGACCRARRRLPHLRIAAGPP
jgi:hypothetical protein